MKKKIIVFFIIIVLISCLTYYKLHIHAETVDTTKIIEISVIDKYDQIKEIHANPEEEKYVLVDAIIDGVYYKDCGIRTKGDTIYPFIRNSKKNSYSYKLKLDFRKRNQSYKGMMELHLNSSMHDATGIREYLVYDIYNRMGIETQNYCFGHLKIGNIDRGLITVAEVINTDYIRNKYKDERVNLYKPAILDLKEYGGADLRYSGNDEEFYKGIIDNTKTDYTTDVDKKRLMDILKNIKDSSSTKVIEENFIDFDKIIKMVAVDKTLANIDSFTRNNLRNFFLCEQNGKIDIITFDYDVSLNYRFNKVFSSQDIAEFDLKKDDVEIYSRITEIILENEVYLKKYYQYVKETLQIIDEINSNNIINELLQKTENVTKSNENKIFTEEQYKEGVEQLNSFMINRKNDYEMSVIRDGEF